MLGPMLKLMLVEDGEAIQYETSPPLPEKFMVKDPSMARQFSTVIAAPGSTHIPQKSPHILLGMVSSNSLCMF
jgi:hypothetical protein